MGGKGEGMMRVDGEFLKFGLGGPGESRFGWGSRDGLDPTAFGTRLVLRGHLLLELLSVLNS